MITKDNRHLWILGGLLAGGAVTLFGLRTLAVPKSFGDVGYFRADHMKEEAARGPALVAKVDCLGCHEKVATAMAESAHKTVNCFVCHGVGREHMVACKKEAAGRKPEDPTPAKCTTEPTGVTDLRKDRNIKTGCLNCHQRVTGRPKEHKQIVAEKHLKKFDAEHPEAGDTCLECHDQHNPAESPEEPAEEEAPAAAAQATPPPP